MNYFNLDAMTDIFTDSWFVMVMKYTTFKEIEYFSDYPY